VIYYRIIYLWILLIAVTNQISAQDVLTTKVVIHDSIEKRSWYLNEIKNQTGFDLLYSTAIHPDEPIKVKPGKYPVKQLLDSLFVSQSFFYVEQDSLLILSPRTTNKSIDSLKKQNVIVEGKVFARHHQPIPYAAIYFKNRSKGTIANYDGEFRFLVPEDHIADTLTISCMGYESVNIPPEMYSVSRLDVQLKPASFLIKDVIVRPHDVKSIVRESYDHIGANYSNKPLLLKAFFREASKQNNDYISLTEAVVDISKSSYISDSDDLIRMEKGRNGTNIKESELVNLKVEGGLYNGLRLDVAKYSTYFYGEDMLNYCDFKLLKTIFFEGRQTYVIGFAMKDGLKITGYNGRLYIDSETYALVRGEFEISPVGLRYAKNELVKKTPRGYRVKPIYAKYRVEYRYYNGYWNLYYAHSELKIKVRKERGKENKGFSCDFVSTSEFVVTGTIKNPEARVRYREAASSNDVLVEQVKNTSADFWGNDNVIVPEEPLQITINKLQKEGVIEKEGEQRK
jgi:hypothetical protein